jgi:S1-C subfamily serine protease
MKTQSLLVALVISAFSVTAAQPFLAIATPNQLTQNNLSPVDINTAEQLATKITVKVQAGKNSLSGVLIGKKGNTYLVMTSARQLPGQAKITLQAADGQKHLARQIPDIQVGKFDTALLEFTSPQNYQLASFSNFDRSEAALNEGRELFVTGFGNNAAGIKTLLGKVTQIPQEAFRNGAQIGYTTTENLQPNMHPNMLGGPILDSFGNLVGISTMPAKSNADNYTYADGSKAPPDKVTEYQQANWSIPIANLLTRLNPRILAQYPALPKLHRVITPTGYMAKLDRQARLAIVRLENTNGTTSGVIVAQEGNSYFVLTTDYAVRNAQNLRVTTHDQYTYKVNSTEVKRSTETDLAIVKFTSSRPYQPAVLGDYRLIDRSLVLAAGWSWPGATGDQTTRWQLQPGLINSQTESKFRTKDKNSFANGYNQIYSSVTHPGMGGGPVFDTTGRIIGIHGRSEGNGGNSLGISIQTFLKLADRLGLNKRNLKIDTTEPVALDRESLNSINLVRNNIAIPGSSSDVNKWLRYGNQLYRIEKHAEAVKAFDRAITLDPQSIDAYFGKGIVLLDSGYYIESLTAFDRAIALVPLAKQSEFYYLWKYRSLALYRLKRYPEALDATALTIRIEPGDPIMYYIQAATKYEQGNKKGAIEDVTIAAKIFKNANNLAAYQEALDDIKQISR